MNYVIYIQICKYINLYFNIMYTERFMIKIVYKMKKEMTNRKLNKAVFTDKIFKNPLSTIILTH